MTNTEETPKAKQGLNIELERELMQELRVEAMQRTIEAGHRVSMTEIIRSGIRHELSKRK